MRDESVGQNKNPADAGSAGFEKAEGSRGDYSAAA
jgi:hypothetical protein